MGADDTIQLYFATYLDTSLSDLDPGELRVVSSSRRTRSEVGWGYTFSIWAFLLEDRGVVSVDPALEAQVSRAVAHLRPGALTPIEIQSVLSAACPSRLKGATAVILTCNRACLRVHDCLSCRCIEEGDIEAYIQLKQSLWPELDADCERNDIRRNIADRIAYGVFENGMMVSASSAPRVAQMQERVEEVGVDTHPSYRRRGYGRSVVSHMTEAIPTLGRVPIYRCSTSNQASLRVAEACGYRKLADSVIFRPV